MKVGLVQFAPVLGDVHHTIRKLDLLSPGFRGCDLLVLPELCNSGYNFESAEQAWETSEVVGDGVFVRYLQSLCQDYNCNIVSGLNEQDNDRLYNTAVLVGPRGLVGKYRKLHLFFREKEIFTPGDLGLPVFDVIGVRLGMLICFDWRFPESWRVLALRGAEVICHPSNLVIPGLAQRVVPVEALLNNVYVLTTNRVGAEREFTFTGRSLIADPRGEVIVRGRETMEEVVTADIDPALARNKRVTAYNDAFADRRPEEYRLICDVGAEDKD